MTKRLFDLALGITLIIPAFIVVAAAALVVAIDSPGSPLFRQVRVGRGRRPFSIIKVRSMVRDTASAASHEIGDEAITRVGAFLRKTKIDELPQIWSVLKGDMSFVGPRPCLPVQERLIAERDKRGVYTARPGITGTAQLAGVDMSTPVELAELDSIYVSGRTWLGDLKIILATLLGKGAGDAVKPAQGRPRR